MAEHKKYKKTGIVIIIGAILVLIMRLYILSAILFLIGLITATYPFIKKNTNEMSGLDIEDSKCNCENCDSKGCNTNYDCNNLNCDNIDSKVISSTSDNKNIIQHDISTEPEVDVKTDASSVIEVDFENSTKPTTDANSSDDEYNSEVDTIIDDNEKDDK